MEVVSEEIKTDQLPPKQKDWLDQLTEAIEKSEKIALDIRSKVLLPHFTIAKMAQLMRISYDEAKHKIDFIAQFGYANNKLIHRVQNFEIVSDAKARLKSIEDTIQQVNLNYAQQIANLKAMREVTSSYIIET